MEDSCVMTMTKLFTRLVIFIFLLNSCETLQDFAGLSKPDLENDIFDQTPDLILPPDFNKVARQSNKVSRKPIVNPIEENDFQFQSQSVQPRVTNFIAPSINIESSPTPSDSLERFKENKKFTIGQWVYGRYVEGFKQGNLYYRPIYDKGYNFSRRYIPDQNVSSFLAPQSNLGGVTPDSLRQYRSDIQDINSLPVID